MNEHRVIEQVLSCLEKILERCGAEGRLDRESARQALDFFRAFADRGHHGKEEIQLFPLLETRGMGSPCGPLAVMRREHELGRLYVQGMEGAVEGASAGEPESVQWFTQHGQSYIRLLREHIGKEDHLRFYAHYQVTQTLQYRQCLRLSLLSSRVSQRWKAAASWCSSCCNSGGVSRPWRGGPICRDSGVAMAWCKRAISA